MRVHALRLGRTKVPYGQFYGGLAGWEGLRALLRFATDKSHFIWVPIHGYLIVHPKEGPALVDAGICAAQAHQHRQYYSGILRLLLDDDEYAQDPDETLAVQLKRLGFRPADVRTLILTHLHEDHVGGVRDLPEAKVVVARDEWDARRMKLFGFLPMFYAPSFAGVKQWQHVTFDSGAFHAFERSQDLFGDGSVRLLPTPGHTPGHLCALVEMDGYQVLVTGDCLYTLRHLATGQVQAIRFDRKTGDQQARSIQRIAELRKQLPDLHLLIGHDHTDYQRKHLLPALEKGGFTPEERRALASYEASLFEENGALRRGAMPAYQPDPGGGRVGTVSEPV